MQTDRDDAHMAQMREEHFHRAVYIICLVQSLKNLCFAIGGTHVAGWVEEAEQAAREGKVVRYE